MKIISLFTIIFIWRALFAWDELRNLEAIIIYGSSVPKFLNTNIDQIFVYAFNSQQKNWHQVTWQIDEKDEGGGYFGPKNNLLDNNEEILVMAQDAGDWASSYYWIDDEDSKNYIRYQIGLNDPHNPAQKKYLYLYKSSTLQKDTTLPQYIQYVPSGYGNDRVEATSYIEGHASGIPSTWKIPLSAGGSGLDILDRQKARVNGHYLIDFKINEQGGLDNPKISSRTGPIRITRRVTFDLKFSGTTIDQMSFTKQYYPYFINSIKANKKLNKDWGISLIRQSYDLNQNAVGMHFYNPFNHTVIDGNNDVVDHQVKLAPEFNWYLLTGDQGAVVNIFQVEAIGSSQNLYYWDNKSGGSADPTGDDTGDRKSYGDIGVLIMGSNIEGSLGLPMTIYFLPANQDSSVGPILLENYQTPLSIQFHEQNLSPPIVVTLPDTSQKQGLTISVPVFVQDLTGLNISSADMKLTFDDAVVEAIGATTTGTIAASWGEPIVNITPDSIKLHFEGTTSLVGSGTLIYLIFKVIGSAGTQSPLHLQDMTFNNGAVLTDTQDGSLTALSPPEITISLPDTSQEKGLMISIPIRISDVTGFEINSIQMSLSFDTSILDATGAIIANTIASSWGEPIIVKTTDGIAISMMGTEALKGSGDLLYINFDVIGDPGQSTEIVFAKVIFNEGVFVAIPQNGSFTTLTPPEVVLSIPDTTGEQRSTIEIPIYVADLTGLNVTSVEITVSFNDSILDAVSATNIGSISSSWSTPQFTDRINEFDIILSGTQPLVGSGKLLYVEFNVIGKVNDTTAVNISHIKFNKGNPTGVPRGGLFTVTPARIDVSLPDTSAASGAIISIPVITEDLSQLDVLSFNMMISYDQEVLKAIAVRTEGTLTESWGTATFNDFPNRAHVIVSGSEPLAGAGTLIYIDFNVIGPDRASSPLHFLSMIFNTGSPLAVKHDGQFTVKGVVPRIAIAIPDTSADQGTAIKIPVKVGDVTGLDVTSVRLSLSFDGTVLDATTATSEGTIASMWNPPQFIDWTDSIGIELSGSPSLSGAGELVFVSFNVVGESGDSTVIHFRKVIFNDGIPIALPQDGVFKVTKIPMVMVNLPDTSGMSGTAINIPITVDDLAGLDILFFNTTISFNPQVLDVIGVNTAGTLTSPWDQLDYQDLGDKVQIIMHGEKSLRGSGTLVYIDFNIIGPDSSISPLHFEDFIFNNGSPEAIKKHGNFITVGVIPVELVLFEGIVEHNMVKLNWTTASETNNYGFEIQRSSSNPDDPQGWQTIGFVRGNGTTSLTHNYVFSDPDVTIGSYSYRLKQIDYNGTFSYSNIIQIIINKPQYIRLAQNYPNPFNSKTVINYQLPKDQYVTLKIYNLLGKQISTLVERYQRAGFYSVNWKGRDDRGNELPSGIYIYRLNAGNSMLSKKMILLE